ncbi:MAG TPA: MoaD/ThiS family protein [Actinomycetales bacterium]
MADIEVRYWAGARAAAGVERDRATATSVADLVALLSQRTPALVPVLAVSSLLVDGLVVGPERALADGEVVEVLPPFAGG